MESDNANLRPSPRAQRPPPPPPPSAVELENRSSVTNGAEVRCSSIEIPDVINTRPNLLFEFLDLFDKFDLGAVREKILDRQLTRSNFITIIWRIFLGSLPTNCQQWTEILQGSRERYNALVDDYVTQLYKRIEYSETKHRHHPLSHEEQNPWTQRKQYGELKDTIYQDVRRTFPEYSFFCQQHIHDLLLQVLFVHCRHYEQTLPYRQGMHEILAMIVYCLHVESARVNDYSQSNDLMKTIYDPQYLEHDAFIIYEKIMEHLRLFYDYKTNKNDGVSELNLTPFQSDGDLFAQTNETVRRVNGIVERLKYYHEPLYCKLKQLDIEPTVYGIRWVRLLFGREVKFASIPSLWTVIFCFDKHFGFVDYFFLAILMKVGESFESRSPVRYSCYLQLLMQQEIITDTEEVIRKALDLARRQPHTSTDDSTMRNADGSRMNDDRDTNHRSHTSSRTPSVSHSLSSSTRSASPSQAFDTNPLKPSSKANSSANKKIPETELKHCPAQSTREEFNTSVQQQKTLTRYVYQFLEQLRTGISCWVSNNEEASAILDGVEEVNQTLAGESPLNEESLKNRLDRLSDVVTE